MDGCVPSRACGGGAESGIGPRRVLRVAGIRSGDDGGRNSSPPPDTSSPWTPTQHAHPEASRPRAAGSRTWTQLARACGFGAT